MLDSKDTKPVNPKGYQLWIFIERTEAEGEAPILQPLDVKSLLIGKDPVVGKDWRQEKEMTEGEMVGWHHRLNEHEFVNCRRWWRTGKSGMLQSMGPQRVRHDLVTKQWRIRNVRLDSAYSVAIFLKSEKYLDFYHHGFILLSEPHISGIMQW